MKKKPTKSLMVVVVAFLIFSGGYLLGYQRSLPGNRIISGITNKISNKSVDFNLFWKTWDLLEKKYDGEVDYQKMLYGAIDGMVNSVNDPYTAFMTPEQSRLFEEELSGTISGIGAEIGIKRDLLTIIAPLGGSPAEKAGLKAGDIITKIDDSATQGMAVDEAVMKIRGREGTQVKLTTERSGQEKEYTITRAKIVIKSVESEIKNGVLTIKISRFDNETTNLLRVAEKDGISKGVSGVILDLRNDPGGYLDAAIEVSSEFIGAGVIVTEKSIRSGDRKEYKAIAGGLLTDAEKYPLVVLVNNGSASASEIVAGAVQDHKRGQLVGEKTFGKGSVQEIQKLEGDSQLKVTVAHWYTPNNKNISKEGLTPDILVELTDEDYNSDLDPQLLKAMEILVK